MNPGFCRFSRTRFLHELHAHLLKLPGVVAKSRADDPVIGSWIDFTFSEHSFTVNLMSDEFVFFVEEADCSDSVLDQIRAHCQPFFDGTNGA